MDAHLDFIRIATWDSTQYAKILARIMKKWSGDWKPGKWLQYSGWSKESFFIGHGEQQGKSHIVINVSGYLAKQVYQSLAGEESWYATK